MTLELDIRSPKVGVPKNGPQKGTWFLVHGTWVHESSHPNTALATGILILSAEKTDHLKDRTK